MFKANECVKDLKNIVLGIEEEWTRLTREQSKVDLAISDMQHFIEITPSLNAADGYSAYKDLRALLELRRDIKNAMNEIRPLRKWASQPETDISRLNQLEEVVNKQIDFNESKKIYKTRVLKSEFGDLIEC